MGYTGQLPFEIGNLTNLTSLVIGETFLEGSIPASIGNLINLKQLAISGILYAGTIPPEIGKLTKLTTLALYFNTHTGTIPSELNNLINATTIYLEGNHLTGPLPDLSALKPGIFNVDKNMFNFTGLEGNADRFVYAGYMGQIEIPLYKASDYFFTEAGGTMAKNTYRWYVNDQLVATKVGDNRFSFTGIGGLRVTVTNSDVPILILSSKTRLEGLPVNLISFSSEAGLNENRLIWQTSSEVKNKGFEIEKSADAKTFHKMAFVDGNGDSQEVNNYHFTDQAPYKLTYYRLKQIDDDGTFTHSKIILARNVPELKVYPNPAMDYIMVSGLDQATDFQVLGADGKSVLNGKINPGTPISVKQIPAGIYILRIGAQTKKLVVIK